MKIVFIFFTILFFYILICLTTFAKSPQVDITYIQLGLIHNYHLDPDFNYPASALISIVDAVKPDMICGEATAQQWQTGLAGLFPFENRILEYAGKKHGTKFVPVDWRTTYAECKEIMEVIKKYSTSEFIKNTQTERENLTKDFEEKFLNKSKNKKLFQYIHTTFLKESGLYHAETERFYGDVPYGFWYRRNLNIFHNCYTEAKRMGAKKVLVAYGAEHQYILDHLFKLLPNSKSVSILDFMPDLRINLRPIKLPPELKVIFLEDQINLKNYIKTLPENSDEKKELITGRIAGFETILNSLF